MMFHLQIGVKSIAQLGFVVPVPSGTVLRLTGLSVPFPRLRGCPAGALLCMCEQLSGRSPFPCVPVSMSLIEVSVSSDSDSDSGEGFGTQLASDPKADTPSSLHIEEPKINGLLFGGPCYHDQASLST